MKEVVCHDCKSRNFVVYSDTVLACEDCGQLFSTVENKKHKEQVETSDKVLCGFQPGICSQQTGHSWKYCGYKGVCGYKGHLK